MLKSFYALTKCFFRCINIKEIHCKCVIETLFGISTSLDVAYKVA